VKIKRYARPMEAFEEIAALHDVLEKKGVSVLRQDVSTLYLIEIQRISLNVGSRSEKKGAALHDVLGTKGVSV
jgi:hypothetical protein